MSQPYEDKVLEFEVTKAFSKFGEVWVKIKRDGYQMPFAFCQFTVRSGPGLPHEMGNC